MIQKTNPRDLNADDRFQYCRWRHFGNSYSLISFGLFTWTCKRVNVDRCVDNSSGVSLLVCSRSYAIHPRNPLRRTYFIGQLRISYFSIVCSRIRCSLMLVSFFTPLLSVVINKTALNKPDQALGFIFGVLRGSL